MRRRRVLTSACLLGVLLCSVIYTPAEQECPRIQVHRDLRVPEDLEQIKSQNGVDTLQNTDIVSEIEKALQWLRSCSSAKSGRQLKHDRTASVQEPIDPCPALSEVQSALDGCWSTFVGKLIDQIKRGDNIASIFVVVGKWAFGVRRYGVTPTLYWQASRRDALWPPAPGDIREYGYSICGTATSTFDADIDVGSPVPARVAITRGEDPPNPSRQADVCWHSLNSGEAVQFFTEPASP